MKTIVSGGAGFIGSHLVKKLLDQGREVVIADDLSSGNRPNLLDLGIRTECQNIDLRDFSKGLKVTRGAETVFHLAATIGNLKYLHDTEMAELDALQSNLMIDTNVLRACLENGVKKIIYTSSCAVYPINRQLNLGVVFSESSLNMGRKDFVRLQPSEFLRTNIDPDGGYGWAKLIGEVQLNWINGIEIGIARIFNAYGPNEPLGEKAHVVADLISKVVCKSGGKLEVRGDGKQSRDFLYVSDCVEALLKLEEKASNPPITVNIGSGQATEIGELARKIVAVSGKQITITFDNSKAIGPVSRTADISMAKQLLGWEPRVSLHEGLRHTYAWVESKLFENKKLIKK